MKALLKLYSLFFVTGDKSIYKEIAASISDLDIGILINNVGQCLGFCRPFAEIQDDRILDNLINW
jgi:hypothetical protein